MFFELEVQYTFLKIRKQQLVSRAHLRRPLHFISRQIILPTNFRWFLMQYISQAILKHI